MHQFEKYFVKLYYVKASVKNIIFFLQKFEIKFLPSFYKYLRFKQCYDIQHNDTQHNVTIQHNNTLHYA